MKLSPNRRASIIYAALAVMPIGMLLVLFQFSSPGEMVEMHAETWLPITLSLLALFSLAAAVAFFSNSNRTTRTRLFLLSASIVLAALVGFLLSWVTAVFYLVPTYFAWTSYREAPNSTA